MNRGHTDLFVDLKEQVYKLMERTPPRPSPRNNHSNFSCWDCGGTRHFRGDPRCQKASNSLHEYSRSDNPDWRRKDSPPKRVDNFRNKTTGPECAQLGEAVCQKLDRPCL